MGTATALRTLVDLSTTVDDDMAGAVRRLLDVEALKSLGCLYSRAVDDREHDVLVRLFATDGAFVRMGVRTEGRDAVRAMYAASAARYAYTRHVTYNHVVVPDGPRTAVGWAAGNAELALRDGPVLLAAYRYDDRYVRRDGRWLILERALSFSYVLPAGELAAALGDPDRMRWPGQPPRPGEYP